MQYQELSSFCFCLFDFSSFPSSGCVRLTPSSGCVCVTSSSGCVCVTSSSGCVRLTPSSGCACLTSSSGCVCVTSSSGCVRLALSLRFRLLSKRENIHIHLLHLIAFHLPATVKVDIHRSSTVLSQTRIQPR
jgi:hypothetical protein